MGIMKNIEGKIANFDWQTITEEMNERIFVSIKILG
jgi:hypothetical protein